MRLLICAMEYPPQSDGIGNVVFNVVTNLKRGGIECIVCSPSGSDIRLGNKDFIDRFGFFGLIFFWYKVTQFLKKNDYDVLWIHNPYFVFSTPLPRCLITIHTTYYGVWYHHIGNTFGLHIYNKIASVIERYCLLKMDKNLTFTCVGQPVCHELKEIGIADNKISLLPNGVDCNHFKPQENKKELRKRFGIPADDSVLLSVGRLTTQKRPQILIDVFTSIQKERKNVTLCFAGKGELLEETKNLAIQRGLQKVIFLGYVDDKDLPSLYSCSDYYIMTSNYEGAPLTLYEAMASGLPCIVSDIPNLDIVQKSNCGLVVNFDDVESATEKILTYMEKNISEHSHNARDVAEKELDWGIIAKRYKELFEHQCM